jgi:hypothetical protein
VHRIILFWRGDIKIIISAEKALVQVRCLAMTNMRFEVMHEIGKGKMEGIWGAKILVS